MDGFARKAGAARWLRVLLAAVCMLLVVLFGTVQAAHFHADNATTHADCSLCATAHVTVQMAQAPAPAPVARVATRVELLPLEALPNEVSAFSHLTRPPPQAALPA
jgi:hypothetical protein